MPWLFLVPLATGAVCTYVSQKSSDDITYLTATIAVVCLFLSLVLAPWQIQAGILVLTVLFVYKVESARRQQKPSLSPNIFIVVSPIPKKKLLWLKPSMKMSRVNTEEFL